MCFTASPILPAWITYLIKCTKIKWAWPFVDVSKNVITFAKIQSTVIQSEVERLFWDCQIVPSLKHADQRTQTKPSCQLCSVVISPFFVCSDCNQLLRLLLISSGERLWVYLWLIVTSILKKAFPPLTVK